MKHIIRVSYLYAAASLVIGPAILVAGSTLFPTEVACGDEGMLYTMTLGEHVHRLQQAQILETVCALFMITVGLKLLITLRHAARQHPDKNYAPAAVLISIALLGYMLIILLAALMVWCAKG